MDARGVLEHLATHGTAGPGVARAIDVGSESYMRFFEDEILEGLVEGGGAVCRLYEGEYGGGKTHLLQLLEETALDRGAAVVRADLSHDLHLSDWRGLMQHVFADIRVKDADGAIQRGLPNILMSLTWDGAGERMLRTLRVPHAGFRDAIRLGAYADLPPDATAVLRQFLLGESVRISQLQRTGIKNVKGAVTKRNAERVLQTVGMSLREIGIPALVILFDETEHMLSIGSRGKDVLAANLLRRLIDGSTAGLLAATFIGFAVLPGTVEQASLVYPALGQRLRVLERSAGGYRRPVLDIAGINSCRTSAEFLEGAVGRITSLAAEIGSPPTALADDLRAAGLQVIGNYVSGYRRPLFKQLALSALRSV